MQKPDKIKVLTFTSRWIIFLVVTSSINKLNIMTLNQHQLNPPKKSPPFFSIFSRS